jgi:hypothetical protein
VHAFTFSDVENVNENLNSRHARSKNMNIDMDVASVPLVGDEAISTTGEAVQQPVLVSVADLFNDDTSPEESGP